ncbi:hypothetical protein Caka_2713 [Coraliomargarita akajimensis DSM 45221]|uniref:Uncharacterized protein n=1 Tax=Coraliomargarita akajimensis (strain DSM 45221 / IAM 15411 / JCM 23193 / KCTC 12865 / 04OKA010-24) TaxID=583355 RepID=D5EPZ5_CORAD|nr:hypothetical protein Caka_2713 [Coraliomargarita akajimensis DSM 45221]
MGIRSKANGQRLSSRYLGEYRSLRGRCDWLYLCGLYGLVCQLTAASAVSNTGTLKLDRGAGAAGWELSWAADSGTAYFIQESTDLINWHYLPWIEMGSGELLDYSYSSLSGGAFLRLKSVAAETSDPHAEDFDGDGIGNWDELMQQSDPLATPDLNNNRVPDDWERYWADAVTLFPPSINLSLIHGESTSQELMLCNTSNEHFDFTVEVKHDLGNLYRYSYRDSSSDDVTFHWNDIVDTGTRLNLISEADDAYERITLAGFDFPFFGTPYTELYVSSNGMITFGAGISKGGNLAIPEIDEYGAFLAAFWDDLKPAAGGDVYYQEVDGALVIQYQSVVHYRGTGTYTFQVVLSADGSIELFFNEMIGDLESATIGLENTTGFISLEVAYDEPYVQNGLAVEIRPTATPYLAVSPEAGTGDAGNVTLIELQAQSLGLAPGQYSASVSIGEFTSAVTQATVPVSLNVTVPPASIELYSPKAGSVFWSHESVNLSAEVEHHGFGVEYVEMLIDDVVLGRDTGDEFFRYTWTRPTPGRHRLAARCVGADGTVGHSELVEIEVLPDVDEDLMDDDWERMHFGSVWEAPSADFDADGYPNIFEFYHGTDPANSLSVPVFSNEQDGGQAYYIVDSDLEVETEFKKQTISAAIESASNFDIIEVRPGIYREALGRVFTRLYVFGAEGARRTIIETQGPEDWALSLRSESVFSSLTFQGTETKGERVSRGSIYIDVGQQSFRPRFSGCRIINNSFGDLQGLISISSGEPWFISCTIAGNRSDGGRVIKNRERRQNAFFVNTLFWNPDTAAFIDGSLERLYFVYCAMSPISARLLHLDSTNVTAFDMALAFDYTLLSDSPARNWGSVETLHAPLDLDLEPVVDGQKDIGADEVNDSDEDGLPDWFENLADADLLPEGDFDGDYLSNLEEWTTGTDPSRADTDGDGLADGDERYGDGTHGDTDGFVTDVRSADTDGDGLPDGWESTYGFDPTTVHDVEADQDDDDVKDVEEFAVGGNPLLKDSDRDQMPDRYEYDNGLDLSFDDTGLDKDKDYLSNYDEYLAGTQAGYFDSDGDLLGDGWELRWGLDPLSQDGIDGQDGDADGDGLSNFREQLFGTNPGPLDADDDGIPDGRDSDGDGVGDALEVSQGSWPQSDSDHGLPPTPDELLKVRLIVGDPSTSESERWAVRVWDLTEDVLLLEHQSPNFGELSTDEESTFTQFRRGHSYELELIHVATDPTKINEKGYPDYDWALEVSVENAEGEFVDVTDESVAQHFAVLDRWDPDARQVADTIPLLSNRNTFSNPWDDEPDRDERYEDEVASKRVLLIKVDMVPDYDRDGVIRKTAWTDSKGKEHPSDYDRAANRDPFYFWVNDDNDWEVDAGDDIPGQTLPLAKLHTVDGIRDLVDFFPVLIDLNGLLSSMNLDEVQIELSGAPVGYIEFADNVLGISAASAGIYKTSYLKAEEWAKASVQRLEAGGLLSKRSLERIRDGRGVFLFEGLSAGSEPLTLTFSYEGVELFTKEMPLTLSPVEKMFRHRTLVDRVGQVSPDVEVPNRLGEPPGLPDSLSNGDSFVFVHGYNVSQQASRGWHSEIFKRLYQSGMKAQFTGLTWHGDTGFNYHQAVINAFLTSEHVASALKDLKGEVTVAAHSLGNMVISSAIADHGFNPERYFLVNAAVPIEAYDASVMTINQSLMANPSWEGYDSRLWASYWHSLFSKQDSRSKLTWAGRFDIFSSRVYNFYSPGEDVVANATGDMPSILRDAIAAGGRFAWVQQEMVKGLDSVGSPVPWELIMPDQHGGWAIDSRWWIADGAGSMGAGRYYSPREADALDEEQLRNLSFFRRFKERSDRFPVYDGLALYGPDGDVAANTQANTPATQYVLLAEAIPALSFGVAANRTNYFEEFSGKNIDMELYHRGWPSLRTDTSWKHSDIKKIPYVYIEKLFEEWIYYGALD